MSNSPVAEPKKSKKEKMSMWWDEDLLKDVREMKKLSGKSMAEIIQDATKLYIAAETPRMIARLKKRLMTPTNGRN